MGDFKETVSSRHARTDAHANMPGPMYMRTCQDQCTCKLTRALQQIHTCTSPVSLYRLPAPRGRNGHGLPRLSKKLGVTDAWWQREKFVQWRLIGCMSHASGKAPYQSSGIKQNQLNGTSNILSHFALVELLLLFY